MLAEINSFCAAGLSLVAIPPDNGKPTKAPRVIGWNQPRSANNPGGYSSKASDFNNCKGFNFGLYHGTSNTLALDLDDVALTLQVFEDTTDVHFQDWLENDARVEIKSPKANRGKLLFKLPVGFNGAGLRQFKHGGNVIFELRSGNCQDVIYGQHPEGGKYQLIGNPAAIPEAPAVLLDMLCHWKNWKPCFDSALGIKQTPPPIAPRKPQQSENIQGQRDPIQEFNQANSVQSVLMANGYKPAGKDRLTRPGSESKAPSAVIMRNCSDGIERVYSHGGDVLNDGFAHDAWDCHRLLTCNGNFKTALNWSAEITKHNQRLFMQEKAKSTPPPEHEQGAGQIEPAEKFVGQYKAERQLFPFVSAAAMTDKMIQIVWLVKNFLEQGSLNLLFGEPGAGKSLLALDWAFCIAAALEWCGLRTQQVDIVILAGEGFAGMQRRLKALEIKYRMKAPPGLFISKIPAQMLDSTNVQWVANTIKEICPNPGLVIIDTLHRNMDGDENSSQDIGKFINNLDMFMKPLVLLCQIN